MAIAIAASGLALWLATGRGGRPPLILSALVFGIAVSGMHYTAMGGVTLEPFVTASSGAPALSADLLAIVVAVVAFGISGIFSCCSCPIHPARLRKPPRSPTSGAVTTAVPEMPAAPATVPAAVEGENPEFGRGTYAPLGGAGAPPRRFARHLPVERDGGTHFLAVEDVVAIHANAHYTYIFDGNDKQFCPLAIGDVESRLDSDRFVRVHRSHIVNIDRVVGYKRSGDNEMVEMASPHHYLVPVSRSRIGSLKSRVATLNGSNPAVAPRRRHRFAAQ